MKTNKSFTKRLKQTRSGKLLSHRRASNHFNAQKTGEEMMRTKRWRLFPMTNKQRTQAGL